MEVFHLLHVKGQAGTGKSALMAAIANRLRQLDVPVILYFCGNSGCQSLYVLKEMLIYQLETLLNQEHGIISGSVDEKLASLNEMAKDKHIVCLIDGLDQLNEEVKIVSETLYACFNLNIVVSSLNTYDLMPSVHTNTYVHLYEIYELDKSHIQQMIHQTAFKRGKKLDNLIMKSILENENCRNPLHLSNVLQRFFMMNGSEFEGAEKMAPGMDGLHQYMSELLSRMPDNQEDMVLYLLSETMKHLEIDVMEDALNMLAFSQSGLKESELEELLKIDGKKFVQIDFQLLMSYLFEVFVQNEDGKWTFKHRLFKEAIQNKMNQFQIEHYVSLFIEYAKQNEAFLKHEGYTYALENQNKYGKTVIENYKTFDLGQVLSKKIVELIQLDNSFEKYCLNLLDNDISETMIDFWVDAFSVVAEDDKSKFSLLKILEKIASKQHLSIQYMFKVNLKLFDIYFKTNQILKCKAILDNLEKFEPKLSLDLQCEYYARLGNYYAYQGEDRKSLEYDESALQCIHLIKDELNEHLKFMELKLVNNLFWDHYYLEKKCFKNILLDALEKTPLVIADTKLCRTQIQTMSNIMYSYFKDGDTDKMVKWREKTLEAGKEWIKRYPRYENMSCMINVYQDAALTKKREYQYSYCLEAYQLAKRCYEQCHLSEYKFNYAKCCQKMALTAQYAYDNYHRGIFTALNLRKSDLEIVIPKYWDEAISLFKELEESSYLTKTCTLYAYECQFEKTHFQATWNNSHPQDLIDTITPLVDNFLTIDEKAYGLPEETKLFYLSYAYEALLLSYMKKMNYKEMLKCAKKMLGYVMESCQLTGITGKKVRVFKSNAYIAFAYFQNNQYVEALSQIKKTLSLYEEFNLSGQKEILIVLYQDEIEALINLNDLDAAREVYLKATYLDAERDFRVLKTVLDFSQKKFDNVNEYAKVHSEIILTKHPCHVYMARHIEDFILNEDFEFNEITLLLNSYTYYLLLDSGRTISEKEKKIFNRYISPNITAHTSSFIWRYYIDIIGRAEVEKNDQSLFYLADEAFDQGQLQKAIDYLKQAKCFPNLPDSSQMTYLLCSESVAFDEMTPIVERMESEPLFVFDQTKMLKYYTWKINMVDQSLKKTVFMKILKYLHQINLDVAAQKHVEPVIVSEIFENVDIKLLLPELSAEEVYRYAFDISLVISEFQNSFKKTKYYVLFADKLMAVIDEKYKKAALEMYYKAAKVGDSEPLAKKSDDELKLRIHIINLIKDEKFIFSDNLVKKEYRLYLLEMYRRHHLNVAEKGKLDGLLLGYMDMLQRNHYQLEKGVLMDFFEPLVLLDSEFWMKQCTTYLVESEKLIDEEFKDYIQFKKNIEDVISLEDADVLNELIEKKAIQYLRFMQTRIKKDMSI